MSIPRTQPSRRDRMAFIAFTSLAVAIIVAVWGWSVRMTVEQAVAGAREMVASVADTAGNVRAETQPDPEVLSAVKAGFQEMIDQKIAEGEQRQDAVDAVAEILAQDLQGAGAVVADDSEVKE